VGQALETVEMLAAVGGVADIYQLVSPTTACPNRCGRIIHDCYYSAGDTAAISTAGCGEGLYSSWRVTHTHLCN
jgi:hypothetical protein